MWRTHAWILTVPEEVRASRQAVGCLSVDERTQAESFVVERARQQYVVAHAFLRSVLTRYVGGRPGDLPIIRSACLHCGAPHGKPRLAAPGAVSFSLTHTSGLIAVAISDSPVGIDAEPVPTQTPMRAQMERALTGALTSTERQALSSIPSTSRGTAVVRCWVRKEAYLKALGVGLSVAPETVEVGLRGRRRFGERDEYVLHELPGAPSHAIAVCCVQKDNDMVDRELHFPMPSLLVSGTSLAERR